MPKLATQKTRHIIPISGKDSLCTAIVQDAREPETPYEYLFCDVRMELPETYQWLDQVEKKLGIKINRVGKSLESVMGEVGKLPGHSFRFCTKLAKIAPMFDYIGKDKAIQYLGIRADEANRISPPMADRPNIETRYPLVETGVNLPMVYKILGDREIMPPSFFWQRLWDAVYARCAESSKRFMNELKPWTISYLFSWRSRSNCFMCFYQRLYEWVGLLEYHPDMFSRAEELERVYGSATSEFRLEKFPGDPDMYTDFHFHQGWPLATIRASADDIFSKRVEAVWKDVVEARHKPPEELDLLSLTSCGLLCGK